MNRTIGSVTIACLLVFPTTASAAPKEQVAKARSAYKKGELDSALNKLEGVSSVRNADAACLRYRIYKKQSQWNLAMLHGTRCVRLGRGKSVKAIRKTLNKRREREGLARLALTIVPKDAQVRLSPVYADTYISPSETLWVEPDTYKLSVSAPGFRPRTVKLKMRHGDTRIVRLALKKSRTVDFSEDGPSDLSPQRVADPRRTKHDSLIRDKYKSNRPRPDSVELDTGWSPAWGWTMITLGAGASIVGSVYVIDGLSTRNDAQTSVTAEEKAMLRKDYELKRNRGLLIGGGGLAFLALGVIVLNHSGPSTDDDALSLSISPEGGRLLWTQSF